MKICRSIGEKSMKSFIVFASLKAWKAEGLKRFGTDLSKWKFICPKCGRVNAVWEFKEADGSIRDAANEAAQNCVGKYTPYKGCEFRVPDKEDICRAHILLGGKKWPVFEFAGPTDKVGPSEQNA